MDAGNRGKFAGKSGKVRAVRKGARYGVDVGLVAEFLILPFRGSTKITLAPLRAQTRFDFFVYLIFGRVKSLIISYTI